MTTMTVPFNLTQIDSDSTVLAIAANGAVLFQGAVTFTGTPTVNANNALVVAGALVTALTTAQVSAFFGSNPDNASGTTATVVRLVQITVNGNVMYIPAFSGMDYAP